MVYENCKIYGEYTRKDGRQHIIVIYPDNTRKTVSYPKYLMEIHLNRYLGDNEDVHHKNEDFTDNRIDNLEIRDKIEHRKYHANKNDDVEYVCDWCNKSFVIAGNKQHYIFRNDKKSNKHFCSKQCVGKYGKWVQNNK